MSVTVIKPFRGSPSVLPNDFLRHCNNGNFKQVKLLIAQNVNIYQTYSELKLTPMHLALHTGKDKLVSMLLGIHERDLKLLEETDFKRATIAFESDLTDEFHACCERDFKSEDEVEAVLLKLNNQDAPKVFYLRRQLKNKDDLCLQLIKNLQGKNGVCDLNHRFIWNDHNTKDCKLGEAYIHLAAYYGMKNMLKRLLANKTVDNNVKRLDQPPLHYAINAGKIETVKILMNFCGMQNEELSCLRSAAYSGCSETFEFVVEKMIETGNYSLKEILSIEFKSDPFNKPLHMVAASRNYEYFLNHKLPIDDEDMAVKSGDGENILHLIFNTMRFADKSETLLEIANKFSKLLTIPNGENLLPVHLLASNSSEDEKLIEEVYRLTFEETNATFDDSETSLVFLETLIAQTNWKSLKFFIEQAKFDVVRLHGNRLLQCAIKHYQSNYNKCFYYLLSHPSKINPNTFYDGSNAFISAVAGANLCFSDVSAKTMIEVLMKDYKIDDVNAVDKEGNSILMYVVSFSPDSELSDYFVNLGADCKQINNDGRSLMHFAAKNHEFEACKYLVDRGVDPKFVDTYNNKAITQAAKNENPKAFELLLQFETDEELDMKLTETGETLLHITAQGCNNHNLELLLERNINFKAVDNDGNLFTHKLLSNRKNIVLPILKKMTKKMIPLQVNARNNSGDSMLLIATKSSEDNVLDFISRHRDEIDFNLVNNKQQSFIHRLCQSEYIVRRSRLFEDSSEMMKLFNEQIFLKDITGSMPLDSIIPFPYLGIEESLQEFLIKFLSRENFKKLLPVFFHSTGMIEKIFEKFPDFIIGLTLNELEIIFKALVDSSISFEVFDLVLEKLSIENLVAKWKNSTNILHLVCESNDVEKIASLMRRVSCNQLVLLANQFDENGKIASDLLNDKNRFIFVNCF